MSYNYNRVILIGRLTADPELKRTTSGTPVTSFSIAIDDGFGDQKQTDFINIVAWKQSAELVCKNWRKGKPILIEGRIKTRSYQANDGSKRNVTEVVADRVAFIAPKDEEQPAAAPAYGAYQQNPYAAPSVVPSAAPMQQMGNFAQPQYQQQGYPQQYQQQGYQQPATEQFEVVGDEDLPF